MRRTPAFARRFPRLALALPALALWVAAAGCELIVDGEVASIRCSQEGAVGGSDCPTGLVCTEHVCVDPAGPPLALGSRCVDDAGCAEGSFCLDPSAFAGAGAFAQGKRRCARPCCSSGECGDVGVGLVCAHPTIGGPGYCRKAADVARVAPGAAVPGATCAAHADCRSGFCDLASNPPTCLDGCCSDTSCAETSTTCRFGERAGDHGFWCSAPLGSLPYGEPCEGDGACASGLCLELEGTKRCSAACCRASDCSPMQGRSVACAEISHARFVRACATLLPAGAVDVVGAACTSDLTCRSGLCQPPAHGEGPGECTDTCCTDDSCGAPGTFRCLPQLTGPPWPLRCEHN